jgi:hypothetical protein
LYDIIGIERSKQMDDLNKIAASIVSQGQEERRRKMIEAYINAVAESIRDYGKNSIAVKFFDIADPAIRHEVETWNTANGPEAAWQVSEAVRIILRRELLHE